MLCFSVISFGASMITVFLQGKAVVFIFDLTDISLECGFIEHLSGRVCLYGFIVWGVICGGNDFL